MVGQTSDPYKNPREALCVNKWNKETLDKYVTCYILHVF